MNEDEPRWTDGQQTLCPALTYYDAYPVGRWLALRVVPPCVKKTCGMPTCHNFGRDYRPEVSSRGVVRFEIVSER